jgi:hypothetical protein
MIHNNRQALTLTTKWRDEVPLPPATGVQERRGNQRFGRWRREGDGQPPHRRENKWTHALNRSTLICGVVQTTYTLHNTHLTCDGRTESQQVNIHRANTCICIKRGRGHNNFRINCKQYDLNSRPWAMILCQASCLAKVTKSLN